MFSDGFLEGQTRDINEGFPPDSIPHTEYYDYLSDSDLEDESSYSEEGEERPCEDGDTEGHPNGDGFKLLWCPDSVSQVAQIITPESPPQVLRDLSGVEGDNRFAPILSNYPTFLVNFGRRSNKGLVRLGKVAIIRDIAAVT